MSDEDPYSGCAPIYNIVADPWLRPLKRRIVEECLRLKISRVLDVGCGTGTLVNMLCRAGIYAWGVDLSPTMLEKAKEACGGSPVLVRGRAEHLPFLSSSFQGAVMSLMLHENPPRIRSAILKEAFRVLGRGGTLFILEYSRASTLPGRLAAAVEHAIERSVGGDHFENFRQFMEGGALAGFLAHLPAQNVRWRPAYFGSMAIAEVAAGSMLPSPGPKDER